MDTTEAIDLVREYKDTIHDLVGDAKVYLFGSYSRGEQRSSSDIDVAIVIPKYEGNDWLNFCGKLWRRTLKVSSLIEPVLMEECHPSPLYETVIKTGIPV